MGLPILKGVAKKPYSTCVRLQKQCFHNNKHVYGRTWPLHSSNASIIVFILDNDMNQATVTPPYVGTRLDTPIRYPSSPYCSDSLHQSHLNSWCCNSTSSHRYTHAVSGSAHWLVHKFLNLRCSRPSIWVLKFYHTAIRWMVRNHVHMVINFFVCRQ